MRCPVAVFFGLLLCQVWLPTPQPLKLCFKPKLGWAGSQHSFPAGEASGLSHIQHRFILTAAALLLCPLPTWCQCNILGSAQIRVSACQGMERVFQSCQPHWLLQVCPQADSMFPRMLLHPKHIGSLSWGISRLGGLHYCARLALMCQSQPQLWAQL